MRRSRWTRGVFVHHVRRNAAFFCVGIRSAPWGLHGRDIASKASIRVSMLPRNCRREWATAAFFSGITQSCYTTGVLRMTKKTFNHREWVKRHVWDRANFRRCKKHYRLAYPLRWDTTSAHCVWSYLCDDGETLCYTARPKMRGAIRYSYKDALATFD